MVDATVFRVNLDAVNLDCLSPDEQTRSATFRHRADGRAWAGARAALRLVLAPRIDVPADRIAFERAEHGRLLLGKGMPTALAFNVARTRGLALVAVSTAPAVGVDVEAIGPVSNMFATARRVLRPEACASVADAPAGEREARFFREWVRHEARLKCRGTGLVEPADDDGYSDDLTIIGLPVGASYAAALAVAAHEVHYELLDHGACMGRARSA